MIMPRRLVCPGQPGVRPGKGVAELSNRVRRHLEARQHVGGVLDGDVEAGLRPARGVRVRRLHALEQDLRRDVGLRGDAGGRGERRDRRAHDRLKIMYPGVRA